MKDSGKAISPKVFLEELKSMKLEIQPNELSDSAKADLLQTLQEMELLVQSLKRRLLREEMPAASSKA